MTLLVEDVIEQARSRHATFRHQRHPNRAVLDFLTGYAKALHGKIAGIDPDVLRTEITQAMPLAVFASGVALPGNRLVSDLMAQGSDGSLRPIDLVPVAQREDPQIPRAAAWQSGQTLFLAGSADSWSRVASLVIGLVLTPVPLTALGDALPVPDEAEQAVVEQVAAFMARRGGADAGQTQPDAAGMTAYAGTQEAAYLADVANRLSGRTFRTRDVYLPGGGGFGDPRRD